jgi:hypothetical protein
MRIFPFNSLETLKVATLHMISTKVRKSLELLDPLVVSNLYEHSSLSLSSLLKNEIDPPPFESGLPLGESSFSPPISSLSYSPYG